MTRLLRAELAKLVRPLVASAFLVFVGLSILWGAAYQETAQATVRAAEEGVEDVVSNDHSCQDWFGLEPGPECERARTQERENAFDWLSGVTAEASLVRAEQEVVGAGGLAVGMATSAFGAIVMMVLAALLVGAEWSDRTMKTVLLQQASRTRIVLTKIAALWTAGIVMILVAWLGLALAGPILGRLFPLPDGPGLADQVGRVLPQFARGVLVIGAFAAIGTVASMATRSAVGGILAGLGALLAAIVASNFESASEWSFGYWVAAWMRFERRDLLVDHLWPDLFLRPSPLLGLVGLMVTLILAATVSIHLMRRAEV